MDKIHQEESILHPEENVDLETRLYYSYKDTPVVVFAVGLGGSGQQDSSTYNLTTQLVEREYSVRTFSPRNSGCSTGYLTLDNYVSDLGLVIEDTSQKTGERPFAIGHSFGGYSLAKILGREDAVEKAVLLAPLLDIKEQNPRFINEFLKVKGGRRLASYLLSALGLDAQRFSNSEDALSFLDSLYLSEPCTSKLQVPAYVLLSGRTNFGLGIRNLKQLKGCWEKLMTDGSVVEVHPRLSHYFAEGNPLIGRRFFERSEHTKKTLDNISTFLS